MCACSVVDKMAWHAWAEESEVHNNLNEHAQSKDLHLRRKGLWVKVRIPTKQRTALWDVKFYFPPNRDPVWAQNGFPLLILQIPWNKILILNKRFLKATQHPIFDTLLDKYNKFHHAKLNWSILLAFKYLYYIFILYIFI